MSWGFFAIIVILVLAMLIGFGIKQQECQDKGGELAKTMFGLYKCVEVIK